MPTGFEIVMQPAIHVNKLSKRYLRGERRGEYRTLREAMVEAARSSWQRVRRCQPIGDRTNSFLGPGRTFASMFGPAKWSASSAATAPVSQHY